MVLAPNDLFSWNNKYNKYNEYNVTVTFTCSFSSYAHYLTLCMLASWSHEGVVFLVFLPSFHSITSSRFPYLGPTDALCSRLGDPAPPSPKWRPHSQGLRTLPYRDLEHTRVQRSITVHTVALEERCCRSVKWMWSSSSVKQICQLGRCCSAVTVMS